MSGDGSRPTPDATSVAAPTQPLRTSGGTLAGGRYVLGQLIGSGGMGLVYRARDERLHRDVAVKLLADNLAADRDARERFLREGRAAARISDPHVVTVHDVGEEGGRPYLVMELVDGPSLADVLGSEGPLRADAVVDIARATLAGLAKAHEAGLLHRDVKPGNLLRTPDGRTKLTDLGVAEAADAPSLTHSGFVVGTRPYLAPERRRGAPASVATDLWALGATLVELLTGEPPPDDGNLPVLATATRPELETLVSRLLADDPADRPRDAAEAAALLWATDPTTSSSRRPTEVLPVEDAGAGSVDAGADAASTEVASRNEDAAVDRGAGAGTPWPKVAIAALGLLAAVTVWNITADEPEAASGSDEPVEAPVDGVERVDGDPAATARNLAEWLREHAGER